MFIFAEEKRPKLQQERPDLSDSELTRLLARMWNELPDKKKVREICHPSTIYRRTQHFMLVILKITLCFCCLSDAGKV